MQKDWLLKNQFNDELRKFSAVGIVKDGLDRLQHHQAVRALELLKPFPDEDLVRIVEAHVATLRRAPITKTVHQLCSEYGSYCEKQRQDRKMGERHIGSVLETTKKLKLQFGERELSTITAAEIRSWLLGLELANITRNRHLGYAALDWSVDLETGWITLKAGIAKSKQRRLIEMKDNLKAWL